MNRYFLNFMEIIFCLCFGKKLKFYEESYYVLLISRRAQLSKHALVLKNDFKPDGRSTRKSISLATYGLF